MSQVDSRIQDSGGELDVEAQRVTLPMSADNKTRIVRQFSCRPKLQEISSLTAGGGGRAEFDNSPVLSRVSSSTKIASAVTDSSKARMSLMELSCETDLEAQNAHLLKTSENIQSARQKIRKLIRVLQSVNRFIALGNVYSERSPSVSAISSESSAASAVIGGLTAKETARVSLMELSCETDLEAQNAPLLTTPENMQSARQRIRKLIRVLQSVNRFIALGNVYSERPQSVSGISSESSAACSVIGGAADNETDPKIVESSATTTTSDEDFTSSLSQSGNGNTGIGLQDLEQAKISKIVNEKNLKALHDIGGIRSIVDALNTDLVNGIIPGERDQIDDHAVQTTPKFQPVPRHYFHFIWEACNNVTTYLLSLAAALSFGFGIKEEGRNDGWYDGAIISLTIIVLVVFQATHKYWKEKAWQKSKNQEVQKDGEMEIHVVRGGREELTTGLCCGDIVLLKKGYQVPADGLFVEGQNLEVDDGLKFVSHDNPFLFHGVMVVNGDGKMIVTAVGMDTKWSKMMHEAARSFGERLNLEVHIDKVTTCIHITGLVITIVIFIVSFLRFVSGKMDSENGYKTDTKGEPTTIKIILNTFVEILVQPKGPARGVMTLLSVSLVGIMDGIPFVISMSIMYWNEKILPGNVTTKDPQACLKMASTTAICTDMVGGLTKHKIEVHTFYVGKEVMSESSMISSDVLNELCEGIRTFDLIPESSFCCMMKEPLLSWAGKKLGMRNMSINPIKYQGQNPTVEPCGVIIQADGAQMKLLWKGPAIDIIKMCSYYYDSKGEKHSMDEEKRFFEDANTTMLKKQMKTIAFACKSMSLPELEESDLTLVGLIGLKITTQEDTRNAIETCRLDGVRIILVSNEDISKLATIARQCSFLTPNSDDMLKGEDFRNFTPQERMEKIETLQVLGNCDAADKQLLVKCLREKGEVVAVIAQGMDDSPALREADIGLTTGTWSSTKAREVSNITIREWNFSFAVQMIKCGRCIYGNIQKFIQLELILNSACILINFIGIASLGDAPITPIQFFGLNLGVAFLGGLAIMTEPVTDSLINMPPISATKALITEAMLRNIVIQTVYQIVVLVILQHCGSAILGISPEERNSMISNSFILCQFFNIFNARELQAKNFFAGICGNHWFWIALCAFIGCQAIFVKIDQILVNGARLNWKLWVACSLIGTGSWLIDYAGKWGSGFISIHSLKGSMTNLAGNCMYFLITDPHLDISMGTITNTPSERGSSLKHPLMDRNPNTIPIKTHPSE